MATVETPPASAIPPIATPLPTKVSVPPELNTDAVFNAEEVLERSLSPRERILLQQIAASLPRYREDPYRDGALSKTLKFVFPTPLASRVGRVTLHGGIVTVVKTGNPFGLLNPEVLGFSW